MTVTRRTFLRKGAMTVLVTSAALDSIPRAFAGQLVKAGPAQDSPEAKQDQPFAYKRETFRPYVGNTFRLNAGAGSVAATLVNVRDYAPSARAMKKVRKARASDSFSLIFRADAKLTDPVSIYDVEHGALGSHALFLTHRAGPRGTHIYEAVFNHAL